MCWRSSVFIRRSAAAGGRSRWRPPRHGELPKQIWAKTKGRTRRNLAVVLIVVAVAAALVYVFAKSPPQQNRSRFGAEGGPVPVLAAPAAKADVPVYLDAVGTIKALNTVTVRPVSYTHLTLPTKR